MRLTLYVHDMLYDFQASQAELYVYDITTHMSCRTIYILGTHLSSGGLNIATNIIARSTNHQVRNKIWNKGPNIIFRTRILRPFP